MIKKKSKRRFFNWKERNLDDSLRDARDFVIYFAVSLEERLDKYTTNND